MNIQLVDDNDQPVAIKERTEVDYGVNIYRVSALWLTNSNGQALLAKRSASKDNDPGKWGPAVAGTVEAGESYDENIYKEANEEIGLEGIAFTKGPKAHISEPRNYFCQWYFASIDCEISEFTMHVEEVDALEWVDIEIMKNELITEPDKYVPAMERIAGDLGL